MNDSCLTDFFWLIFSFEFWSSFDILVFVMIKSRITLSHVFFVSIVPGDIILSELTRLTIFWGTKTTVSLSFLNI